MEGKDVALLTLMSKRGNGAAITGVSLAGAALAVGLVGVYAINQASKARAHGAEETAKALSNGNMETMRLLAQTQLTERTSRETWQNTNTPTMTNYIDVAAGSGSSAGSNATSDATSAAVQAILLQMAGGQNNGNVCPSPVSLFQPAMPVDFARLGVC